MFMSVGGRASGWDGIVYSYIGTLDVVICRKGGGGESPLLSLPLLSYEYIISYLMGESCPPIAHYECAVCYVSQG